MKKEVDFARDWIRRNVPELFDINSKLAHIYLGVLIGPRRGLARWSSVHSKWRDRSHALAASGAGPALLCKIYNQTIVTTLSYPAQIELPPTESFQMRAEAANLARICKLPFTSFRYAGFFDLAGLFSTAFKFVLMMAASTLVRAAVHTLKWWQPLEVVIDAIRQEASLAAQDGHAQILPLHWDTFALALNLRQAAAGFPNDQRFVDISSKLIFDTYYDKPKYQRLFTPH